MLDVKLMQQLREYIRRKTGKLYFKSIKDQIDNIQITCPFHKDGQESKPSASIRKTYIEGKSTPGTFHCFTCGQTMNISQMVEKILGPLYNADEVETLFQLSTIYVDTFIQKMHDPVFSFKLDTQSTITEADMRRYRYYHPYLEQRHISIDIANIYDIGYDKLNDQITFPIRDKYKNIIGVGRRSIKRKIYRYPIGMIKPLYGVYELPQFYNYLWICEGPFNLWSLRSWNKSGVALLGTGTEYQYKELLNMNHDKFVLALDPDDAGIKGTYKLGNLLKHHNKIVYVALLPEGKDINDLTKEEFDNMEVVSYDKWFHMKYTNLINLGLISSQ